MQGIIKVLGKTDILGEVNAVGLLLVELVGLANLRAPILNPLGVHEGATKQQEGLTEVAHRVLVLPAHGWVVLVVPRDYLVLPFLLR